MITDSLQQTWRWNVGSSNSSNTQEPAGETTRQILIVKETGRGEEGRERGRGGKREGDRGKKEVGEMGGEGEWWEERDGA